MKHLKTLALVGVLAGLMAFVSAGSASATVLTCGPSICPAGTFIHADSEGHIEFHPPIGTIECGMTVEGVTTNVGSSTETVKGNFKSHVFTTCNAEVKIIANGSFEIHTEKEPSPANNNGTVTSSGTQFTIVFAGFHCIFGTNKTHLGTITGSANTGGTATWHLENTTIPRTGGSSGIFCGGEMHITGSLLIDTPMVLNVD